MGVAHNTVHNMGHDISDFEHFNNKVDMLFIQKWTGFYYGRTLEKSSSKGQQISKQNCPAVTSPKGGICFSILTRWKYLKL